MSSVNLVPVVSSVLKSIPAMRLEVGIDCCVDGTVGVVEAVGDGEGSEPEAPSGRMVV